MFFQDKLLTPVESYLNNNVTFWNRGIYNVRSGFTNSNNFWYVFQIIPQQKKALTERYCLLKDKVFCFLTIPIVTTKVNYYDNIPVLIFDDLNIHCDDLYDEALKHLKKDISCYLERFNKIENRVEKYNKDFKKFEKEGINCLTVQYFIDNNIDLTKNSNDEPTSKTINKDILYDFKNLWFRNADFELLPIGNELKIKGMCVTTFSNEDEKTHIMNCINNLKKYDNVIERISYFKTEAKEILNEGQNLSKEISRNIVTEIERKEYRTTCEDCPKLFNFSRRKKRFVSK